MILKKNAVSPYIELIQKQNKKLIHVANKMDLIESKNFQ